MIINFIAALAGPYIANTLEAAYGAVDERIDYYGNVPILAASTRVLATFNWEGAGGVELHTWNVPGQSTTWEVLADALLSVFDYMDKNQWGSATFQIFDRATKVGHGTIS